MIYVPFLSSAGDSMFADVLLLMHCEGADAGTSFTDSSSYARTLTANGSVTTSTDQFDEGATSAKYPNAASTYIDVSSPEDFKRGSGDITVEFSIYIVATAATRQYIMRKKATGSTSGFAWLCSMPSASSTDTQLVMSTGTAQFGALSFGVLGTGAWKKCAYERYGNTYSTYVDGTRINTVTEPSNSMATQTGAFEVGSSESFADTKPNYYLDEVRITAAARYQGAASYTLQSGEFPNG